MEHASDTPSPTHNPPRIIPFPHFQTWGKRYIEVPLEGPSFPLRLSKGASKKEQLAVEWIAEEVEWEMGGRPILRKEFVFEPVGETSPGIHLIDWSRPSGLKDRVARILDPEDRKVLDDSKGIEQDYVIRTLPDRGEVWMVAAGPQGLLYAAATLLQLLEPSEKGLRIQEAHVRDYPDFPYRASADWLLRAEINRWAYDWGDGKKAFVRRIKRQLDFCLRYKINMVFFDGFGWNSEKFPGYAGMMRDLNGYARDRGIKLIFSGFGANYDRAKVQPEHNIGQVHYNRKAYPRGEVYPCFGEVRTPEHPMLGTCRSNEALNLIKSREMSTFVRSVEPGALYIHFEDMGLFERAQERWLERCAECRTRWPNDNFAATDGGAGAIAHGCHVLLESIFGVRNSESGYDASRDCTVIPISPAYAVESDSEDDWDRVLDLWSNVVSLLPDHPNIQIGFREIFPRKSTNQRWVDAYKERLKSRGLNSKTFIFFLGGADQYSWHSFNYPFVATSIMSGMFEGGTSLYHFNGGLHQEPLQLLNAEFAWNVRAPGSLMPDTHEDCTEAWKALMKYENMPESICSEDGFLGEACRQIYGGQAGRAMYSFFSDYVCQPRSNGESLAPVLPDKLFPLSILWRILALDENHWNPSSPDSKPQATLTDLGITYGDWQRRLSHVWGLYARVTGRGRQRVGEALSAPDLNPSVREDLVYLEKCLQVGELFSELISSYHELLSHDSKEVEFAEGLEGTWDRLRILSDHLMRNFNFDTVCPVGGDQSSWDHAVLKLRNQLEVFSASPVIMH